MTELARRNDGAAIALGAAGAVARRVGFARPRKAGIAEPDARVARKTAHVADLDVLRGIAAILVVLFHFSERTGLSFLCPRGYLGVDLFFAMSGYVLMHAYRDKLVTGRLSIGRFLAIRLIRLGPMILLGTTIAALIELGRPSVAVAAHLRDIAEAWIRGCLLLPTFRPTTLEHVVFPLDGPVWSLFFELVSNVVLALVLVRRRLRTPLLLCLGASLLLVGVYLAGHPSIEYAGAVSVAFGWGFPRVGLSFSLGILLFVARRRWFTLRLDRRAIAASFVLLCFVPVLPGALNPIIDGIAMVVVLPLIVLASASERPVDAEDAVALWSARISYPLYAIHYPFVRAAGVVLTYHGFAIATRLAAVVMLTLVLVALAACCDRFYDRPVRARLSRALAAG